MSKFSAAATSVAGTHELKQRVLTCLDRLSDRDTLSHATAELESIARTLTPDYLFPFLSCCLSVDSAHKAPVRSQSVRLLSVLASTHRNFLSPHLPKIISSLLRRLRDSDSSVRSACVDVVISLSQNLTSSPFRAFLEPLLAAVLIEQDYNVQIGSALCLSAAIGSSPEVEEAEMRKALPKLVKLARSESFRAKPALLGLIGSVVEVNGGSVVNTRSLMSSVVNCVVDLLSSEDWAARKAAAEVLEKLAVTAKRDLAAEVKKFCVDSLEGRRFDKVKIARETLNRALAAWKEIPAVSEEDSPVSMSISSNSKDTTSGGCSSHVFQSYHNAIFETHQPKKTMSKSRSSLSDESTVTFSPPISKSSSTAGYETPQSKNTRSKSMPSMLDGSTAAGTKKKKSPVMTNDKKLRIPVSQNLGKKPCNWKIDMSVPKTLSVGVASDDDIDMPETLSFGIPASSENETSLHSMPETSLSFFKKTREEKMRKFGRFGSASRVVPFQDETESEVAVVNRTAIQDVFDNNAEFEGLSVIREQLVQIERQQSTLLDVLQSFMGASRNGITSLETRVSGLERALDQISYDMALQNGMIPNDSSGRKTCCMLPGAEFLSPKFWRTESRYSAAPKSFFSGSKNHMPNRDAGTELMEANGKRLPSDVCRDPWRSMELNSIKAGKSITQNQQRVKACVVGRFDGAVS
ncbi:hypothetical protein Nepgr_017187 [Nepenthes gracilis]|uniref:TORTIFOLIA1/SINE1-2 N-terminal domain-containing protein n=1 Tax=Nepenthes gracilis TaxID=150966 RepID=A0AAD3XT24_NEPGR|nr:hypothetical protein Nepgr_017187 [Nepenthes gracilis]